MKNQKDINGNEAGWERVSYFKGIKPLERYDIMTQCGTLKRAVYGNEIISMKCGIAPKIIMMRKRF